MKCYGLITRSPGLVLLQIFFIKNFFFFLFHKIIDIGLKWVREKEEKQAEKVPHKANCRLYKQAMTNKNDSINFLDNERAFKCR